MSLEFRNTPINIELSDLTVDERLQMRSGLDVEHVTRLKTVLANGYAISEPIAVVELEDGRKVIADGFHRYEAHRQADQQKIKAKICYGTFEQALEYAEEANLQHGLGLKHNEIKRILFQRLDRGQIETLDDGNEVEWLYLSNAFLAALLGGVPSSTVSNWMKDYLKGSQHPDDVRATVYGRDGRAYNIEKVVSSNVERTSDTVVTVSDNEAEKTESTDEPTVEMSGPDGPLKVTFTDEELAVLAEFIEAYDHPPLHVKKQDWMPMQLIFASKEHQALFRQLVAKGAVAKHSIREAYRPLNAIEMKLLGVELPSKDKPAVVVVDQSNTGSNGPVEAGVVYRPAQVVERRAEVAKSIHNGSDDENQALMVRKGLELLMLEAISYIQPFVKMKGIRMMHYCDQGAFLATLQMVDELRDTLNAALTHTELIESRLRLMMATGKPYDEVPADERARILSGWGGMNGEQVVDEAIVGGGESPTDEGGSEMERLAEYLRKAKPVEPSSEDKAEFEIEFEPQSYDESVYIAPEVAGKLQMNLLKLRSYCEQVFGNAEDGLSEALYWVTTRIRGMTTNKKWRADQLDADEAGRLVNMFLNEHGEQIQAAMGLIESSGGEEQRDETPFDPDSATDKSRVRSKMRDTAKRRWGNGRPGITFGNANRPKVELITFAIGQDRRLTAITKTVAMIDVVPDDNVWYVCDEHGVPFGYSQLDKEPGITNLKKYVSLEGMIDIRGTGVEIKAMVGAALEKDAICDEILRLEITKQVEATA